MAILKKLKSPKNVTKTNMKLKQMYRKTSIHCSIVLSDTYITSNVSEYFQITFCTCILKHWTKVQRNESHKRNLKQRSFAQTVRLPLRLALNLNSWSFRLELQGLSKKVCDSHFMFSTANRFHTLSRIAN